MFKKPFNKGGNRFSDRSGGGRSFERGGGGGWNSGPRDRAPMHRATCASCGNGCEVPFKPNGSKPVYCSDCFHKNDAGDRPSFSREARPSRPSSGFNDQSAAQLKEINAKLDAILEALHANV